MAPVSSNDCAKLPQPVQFLLRFEFMRHVAFESVYRPDFEVVEQRDGKVTLYPHTEQLPVLLRALNLEFYGALPPRIARVDHRGDGYHKIVLRTAALMFCGSINAARPDNLRLFRLTDHDLVARVSVVQQITEERRRGLCHRFRFYAGEDFFPEIYLSGKRVIFSDHVLQRFSTRVPNRVGADLSNFLLTFYGSPIISMPTGPGRAFILPYLESILALTYKETESEFFVTTCLTINEMNSLEREMPPHAHNPHYGPAFSRPRIRNWFPLTWMIDLYERWERKVGLPSLTVQSRVDDWREMACWIKDVLKQRDHGPGSRVYFMDNIPGPCCLEVRPGEAEPRYDEVEIYKKISPEEDWETLLTEAAA
jgi:hypothetical protein